MNSLFSLKQMRDKFFTLSAREQLLVVTVVSVALYFAFETLVYAPQSERNEALMTERTLANSQMATLRAEILSVNHSNVDLEKAQLDNAQLKRQMVLLNAVLSSLQVSAPQIGDLVKGVLKDYPRVALVSLKTVPVTTLLTATAPVTPANTGNAGNPAAPVAVQKAIYRHGVDVELQGNYLDLLAYLKNLEANSQHVFWSDVKLLTLKQPDASLRFTIFILSDQPVLKIS